MKKNLKFNLYFKNSEKENKEKLTHLLFRSNIFFHKEYDFHRDQTFF